MRHPAAVPLLSGSTTMDLRIASEWIPSRIVTGSSVAHPEAVQIVPVYGKTGSSPM